MHLSQLETVLKRHSAAKETWDHHRKVRWDQVQTKWDHHQKVIWDHRQEKVDHHQVIWQNQVENLDQWLKEICLLQVMTIQSQEKLIMLDQVENLDQWLKEICLLQVMTIQSQEKLIMLDQVESLDQWLKEIWDHRQKVGIHYLDLEHHRQPMVECLQKTL
jgi:hypothetical protein